MASPDGYSATPALKTLQGRIRAPALTGSGASLRRRTAGTEPLFGGGGPGTPGRGLGGSGGCQSFSAALEAHPLEDGHFSLIV